LNGDAMSPPTSTNVEPISVWLVEDHELFRNSVTRVLARAPDLKPRAFGDCEAALAAMQAGEPPHVMLLDIGLPGMSGLEGITRFKSLSPRTHIIILTSFDDQKKIGTAIQSGASGYLLKTTEADRIEESIRQVLEGGAALDSRIARHVFAMLTENVSLRDYGLTPREQEVLQALVAGQTMKAIAADFGVSFYTVDTHLRRIYAKLDVQSRTHAVTKALKERLV
jgi:DNA-binding NarL/FixJ family response regulator